ncbi:unnamed protein product [Fusarium venenatum]|uniref:Uncharacterized protein n=1 Tax=Fusarium venenatum TaxID=56646 RepID=A0A2L2TRK8_9HYPO|nr:uncharacterized protein FVRRES_02808 [Fusarium venenatum]CEI66296.1 unnamed protein product [Fusarium venenatum]
MSKHKQAEDVENERELLATRNALLETTHTLSTLPIVKTPVFPNVVIKVVDAYWALLSAASNVHTNLKHDEFARLQAHYTHDNQNHSRMA